MATRIRALAALHPDGDRDAGDRHRAAARAVAAAVVSPERCPTSATGPSRATRLPWRRPVIVASTANAEALDATLGDRYVSEFFGLRPEVLLTLYAERGLWDHFLARVR